VRTLFIPLVTLALVVGASYADGIPRLGLAVKVPWALSVQLTLPAGFAIEVGLSQVGPAVFAAKLYVPPLDLARLLIVPVVGLGGAVAFLPGDIVATGFYALAGIEIPIPKTSLSLLGDLALLLPWSIGNGTPNFGAEAGLRLDFKEPKI
jgi:hypothetical protein